MVEPLVAQRGRLAPSARMAERTEGAFVHRQRYLPQESLLELRPSADAGRLPSLMCFGGREVRRLTGHHNHHQGNRAFVGTQSTDS